MDATELARDKYHDDRFKALEEDNRRLQERLEALYRFLGLRGEV